MWHSRPPRDPHPPFMANTILNFHFDYLHPSLIKKQGKSDFCLLYISRLKSVFLVCSFTLSGATDMFQSPPDTWKECWAHLRTCWIRQQNLPTCGIRTSLCIASARICCQGFLKNIFVFIEVFSFSSLGISYLVINLDRNCLFSNGLSSTKS